MISTLCSRSSRFFSTDGFGPGRCLLVLAIVAAATPVSAKISARPKVFVDGHPASHALISLYNCKTGSLEKGPLSAADDGSVSLDNIDPGTYCIKTEVSSGYGTKEIQIDDKTSQQRIDVVEITPALSLQDRILPVVLCLFTVLLVVYPIGRFLAKPWTFRREHLIGLLSGESMKLYYIQFHAGVKINGKSVDDESLKDGDFTEAFRTDFEKWYGRRYYIAPVVGLAALTATCMTWGCISLWGWESGLHSIESMHGLVAASIAGAFVWIIADEIDRLRRRDFTSHDVYYYIFRLLLAIPFGWALTRLQVTLQVGIPLAFFLGAFPTTSLFTAARRVAGQQLKLGDDPASGKLELEQLQSVGKNVAERFKDEGISTITQLAYADPLDLTIRTNFDFDYVVDCVSQSLFWMYLGDKVEDVQIYSLRGAQEVSYLYTCLTSSPPRAEAVATVQEIATDKLKISKEALQITLQQVAEDPFTVFLCKIW